MLWKLFFEYLAIKNAIKIESFFNIDPIKNNLEKSFLKKKQKIIASLFNLSILLCQKNHKNQFIIS